MSLEDLGYNDDLEKFRKDQNLDSFDVGRVISQHKDRYVIKTNEDEFDGELVGNLRFNAESKYDFPAVGDWVAFMEYDEGKALIHAIYPRHTIIERRAVGKSAHIQIIATNVDFGLIVQAVNRDFNLNRLERYLTICHASKVNPIIVLSKIDLINNAELESIMDQVQNRVDEVPVFKVTKEPGGYTPLVESIKPGKTYCLLGSSGVGKSTLLNHFIGEEKMQTGEISSSVNKGRHITSHRELIVLKNGGIMIDNPGMREVGMTETSVGLETTFSEIMKLANDCRFKDCSHMHEEGCAVIEALDNGELDREAYTNFRKLQKEQAHFESDAIARKKKDKDLGKLIKQVKKQRKDSKY